MTKIEDLPEFEWTGGEDGHQALFEWMASGSPVVEGPGEHGHWTTWDEDEPDVLQLQTDQGIRLLHPGDKIVRDEDGTFHHRFAVGDVPPTDERDND